MKKIILTDSSLRDGNHSVKHNISIESIQKYCEFAELSGINIVEVGHGNGLSASSLLIGISRNSDYDMLNAAKKKLKKTKLGVHTIPGLSTIDDAKKAIDLGVDVFRVATHCTEATLSKSHLNFLSNQNIDVYGVLMMTALADVEKLVEQAKIMEDYGAMGVIIMDSTGSYLPEDVKIRIENLKSNLNVKIGFHAHNNLGCAVSNSLIAVQSGADMIDACIRGFGAGAGNAPLEILVPIFERSGFDLQVNFQLLIKEADNVMNYLVPDKIHVAPIHVLTGLKKLFSGFEKPIIETAKIYDIEYSSLVFELGERKLVAGQEDIIIEIAESLKKKTC